MDMLRQKGWLFGGENSGHILCLDRHTTGDGIVSALQVLSALREEWRRSATTAGQSEALPAETDQRRA
jgi:phosphoglucosamine mutase